MCFNRFIKQAYIFSNIDGFSLELDQFAESGRMAERENCSPHSKSTATTSINLSQFYHISVEEETYTAYFIGLGDVATST
nr:hypothetical protein [Tanacetum cinerariifolium]